MDCLKRVIFWCLFATLLTGCGAGRVCRIELLPEYDIELVDTPFFPQQQYQCGPAAVAMLLSESGLYVVPDMLSDELYLPGRKGSVQLEVIASIRNHGLIPYRIQADAGALMAELRAGRPVLVLQNLGLRSLPAYHYAVVIGVLTDGRVVLRSGITERLVMEPERFLSSWEMADNWAVVALGEGELPADHDLERYLDAVADIEETGNADLAEQGYMSVIAQHPYNEPAIFGLANTMYKQEHYTAAATFFSHLLQRNPDHAPAANNLAETLATMGCFEQALELLDTFL